MASNSAIVSWEVVGDKKDMSDFIVNLDPDQTLLTNKFGRCSITATTHEWLSDGLRPPRKNQYAELMEFSTAKASPRKHMFNYVQQMQNGYNVSDITQAIDKYGVSDEIGYQFVKAGKEIASDLEYAICFNDAAVAMDDGGNGEMGGIPYFLDKEETVSIDSVSGLVTLNDHGLNTGDPVILTDADGTSAKKNKQYYIAVKDKNSFYLYTTPDAAQASIDLSTGVSAGSGAIVATATKLTRNNVIDAAQDINAGKLSLDIISDAMEQSWGRGGNIDTVVMSPKQKKNCANLGGVVKVTSPSDNGAVSSLDMIENDFGEVALVAHRMYRGRDSVIDLLDTEYFNVGWLIPFHTEDLDRTGTYTQKIITGVVGMECRAPYASARIKNLTGDVYTKPVIVKEVTA